MKKVYEQPELAITTFTTDPVMAGGASVGTSGIEEGEVDFF